MAAKAAPMQADDGIEKTVVKLSKKSVSMAESVGERIKWARERQKLTQKELAKMTGKSRASIVQYEQDKIAAPLDVIATLAEKLNVAPEFIAFGRSGIAGVRNAEEEILIMEELGGHDANLTARGGWAVPRQMFKDYGVTRSLKMVCIASDEPKFEIKAGDRMVVDTDAVVNKDGLYVCKTAFGARVVRVSLGFSSETGVRVSTGTDGSEETVDPAKLDLVGSVVGIFRRTF